MMKWNFKYNLLLLSFACFLTSPSKATTAAYPLVNFANIPSAHTLEDSRATFDQRARLVVDFILENSQVGTLSRQNNLSFYSAAMVRLATGQKVDEVNAALLDPASHVYGDVGTDFQLGPCQRQGDYDFALIGLVTLPYYADHHPGLLSEPARQRLVNTFLTQRGREHYMTFNLGMCGTRVDTENHILMIEISRFLTNQILYNDLKAKGQYNVNYDNWATGFNYFLIDHLRQYLKNDFSEFNSKPYQGYTVFAIQTLYNHSQDSRVKLTAQMVLDYLSAKFAMQSAGLRRSVPFRRQPAYKDESRLLFNDGEAARHIILGGNTDALAYLPNPYQPEAEYNFMLSAALSNYRIPDLILDFMMRKGARQIYQKFSHEGVEIYSASDTFTLAAGGRFGDYVDFGSGELDAWAVPTTIVPSQGGILRNDMVRIQGHRNFSKRNNTCVARGFACGINPIIPPNIPASCRQTSGNWTFLNFNAAECPLKYGFYVAVYNKACDTLFCRDGGAPQNFGFLEVVDAHEVQSFTNFQATILNRNQSRNYQAEQENTYTTSLGDEIKFIPSTGDLTQWPITTLNGVAQERHFDRWPLADGDFMHANRDAKVMITNPLSRKTLMLDVSDFKRPKRTFGVY